LATNIRAIGINIMRINTK